MNSPSQSPGWYAVENNPATIAYWDGTQWADVRAIGPTNRIAKTDRLLLSVTTAVTVAAFSLFAAGYLYPYLNTSGRSTGSALNYASLFLQVVIAVVAWLRYFQADNIRTRQIWLASAGLLTCGACFVLLWTLFLCANPNLAGGSS